MGFKGIRYFKILFFSILLSTETYAGLLHLLAHNQNWEIIRSLAGALEKERFISELNDLDNEKTVLDIVGMNLSSDHEFYIWLKDQGAVLGNNNETKNSTTIQQEEKEENKSQAEPQPEPEPILSVEEGIEKIKEAIDNQIDLEELEIRREHFNTKNMRKSFLEGLKTFQGATKQNYTSIIGKTFEVVCINQLNNSDVYIIYLDQELTNNEKRGVHGCVYLTQRLDSSNQNNYITIVKKITKTEKELKAFKSESLFAEFLELSTGNFESETHLYLFMLYAGITLPELPRGLPPILRYEIIIELIKAAINLHEEKKIGKDIIDIILHRDIKPENIGVLPTQDGKLCVRIFDLGDACFKSQATNEEVGSPAYQAPETFKENRAADAQAPLYCEQFDNYGIGIIGAMLYLDYDMKNFQKDKKIGAPYLYSDLVDSLPGVFGLDEKQLDIMRKELSQIKIEDDPLRFLSFELIQSLLKLANQDPNKRPKTGEEIAVIVIKLEMLLTKCKEKSMTKNHTRKRGNSLFNLPINLLSSSTGSESPSSREKSPKTPQTPPKTPQTPPKKSPTSSSFKFPQSVRNTDSVPSIEINTATPRLRRSKTVEGTSGKKVIRI